MKRTLHQKVHNQGSKETSLREWNSYKIAVRSTGWQTWALRQGNPYMSANMLIFHLISKQKPSL